MPKIVIIDYGSGNLASLKNAFHRLGMDALSTDNLDMIRHADKLVLPGVGAFPEAMNRLEESGLCSVIHEMASTGIPILGICLGMQLFFSRSMEQGNRLGLGWISGTVRRFQGVDKIPHMGWNWVEPKHNDPLFEGMRHGMYAYFVHSYLCQPDDASLIIAQCEYGGAFCAGIRKDNLLGVQFHPEKSHDSGLRILGNFIHYY
jgi:glutamine amidotransferase